MNAEVPGWLRTQVRWHNLHALWLAFLSLCSSIVAWTLIYFFFVLILFGLETAATGDLSSDRPLWLSVAPFLLVVGLLLWGLFDHWQTRFSGVSDRAIVGWHVIGDVLLLPVRLTFAIWGNFDAVRWLDAGELARAWELLVTIQRAGKGRLSALTLVEPDFDRLYRLLSTLQMLDLIDLHRGEGDWYYTVRSTHWEELGRLLAHGE